MSTPNRASRMDSIEKKDQAKREFRFGHLESQLVQSQKPRSEINKAMGRAPMTDEEKLVKGDE